MDGLSAINKVGVVSARLYVLVIDRRPPRQAARINAGDGMGQDPSFDTGNMSSTRTTMSKTWRDNSCDVNIEIG